MSNDTKKTKEEQSLIIGDDVWNRVVQIIQEGMLTGIDVTDLMRQIRVCFWDADPNTLHLTEDYRKMVSEGHQQMIRDAKKLRAQATEEPKTFSLIGIDGGKSGGESN